jgi:hypothetical protein
MKITAWAVVARALVIVYYLVWFAVLCLIGYLTYEAMRLGL